MMVLDSYERRARLTPGLLVVAPIAFTVVTLGLRENPVAATSLAVLSAIGGPYVLASLVRDRGLALQATLFVRWGGPPTRRFLQFTTKERSAAEHSAWRRDVERASTITLPTEAEETSDLAAAEGTYDVAVRRLRSKTQDHKQFRLLFDENRNYGFWRNLLAMRPFGIAVASLCLLVIAIAAAVSGMTDLLASTPRATFVFGLLVTAIWIAFWISVPRESAVKRASERYAERLLDGAASVP